MAGLATDPFNGPEFPVAASLGGSAGACRFDMAAMVALSTWTSGGLMPHARHGGRGVRAFAVVGSKLEGTGFEKEQMGHTQVALSGGADARAGLPRGSGVVDALLAGGGPRVRVLMGLG